MDSEIIAVRSGLRAVKILGLSYTEDEYIHRFLGTTLAAYFSGLEADHLEAFGTTLPEGFADRLLQESKAEMDANLAALPGVHDALKTIEFPLAVASSSGLSRLRFKLEKTGLLNAFDPHVYSGEDVMNGKPAPDLYLHTAEKLNVPATACVAVEDSVHGVVSAKSAGITVIGFTGGGHCRAGHGDFLFHAGADRVVNHMDQLKQTLSALS